MTNRIEKSIDIAASPARVFQALTDSAQIPRYFPLNRVESEWVVGGAVRYHGEIDGKAFTDHGVIEVLEPPRRYQYRYWSDNHGTAREPGNEVTICYQLLPHGNGTRLVVTQTNLPSQALYSQMNDQVWDFLLGQLNAFLERNDQG